MSEETSVEMELGLTVLESSDMRNVGLTATDPSAIPHMQSGVIDWCRRKVELVRAEATELEESVRIAALNDFKRSAFDNAAKKASQQVIYYEKMLAALEAGYCIFPTTDVDLFAVRTSRIHPDANQREQTNWGSDPADRSTKAMTLPTGEGRFVGGDTKTYYRTYDVAREQSDKSQKVVPRKFFFSKDFDAVEFPFEMRRPQIMRVTGEAMALKIFDEMGLLPAQRRGDPIIVGRIINPRNKRRVSFLIAWHIDTREL